MKNWIKDGLIELLKRGEISLFNNIVSDLYNLNLSDADLSYVNLSRADLSDANLSDVNLSDANLRRANLSDADLRRANLSDADLSRANLSDADLSRADLNYANLSRANLSRADLSDANLSDANLSDADLSRADLNYANLSDANLSDADLSDANLSDANLSRANLSNVKNQISPSFWLAVHFKKDDQGFLVYKAFGNTFKIQPEKWLPLETGKIITETANFTRQNECASGVNFGTLKWIEKNLPEANTVWKCRIRWEWLADVCVPYNTDGKARCQILELVEKVGEDDE
jgi:uncharacterized protein YjbI with pentapeptide repeats